MDVSALFSLAERAEGGPYFAGERLGLLQGGEVASLAQLVITAAGHGSTFTLNGW